jgi:ABC-type branched-subunit amino acid transport system permease subunit
MKPSREFKANFTTWGFFFVSLLLVVVIVVVVWHARTSPVGR